MLSRAWFDLVYEAIRGDQVYHLTVVIILHICYNLRHLKIQYGVLVQAFLSSTNEPMRIRLWIWEFFFFSYGQRKNSTPQSPRKGRGNDRRWQTREKKPKRRSPLSNGGLKNWYRVLKPPEGKHSWSKHFELSYKNVGGDQYEKSECCATLVLTYAPFYLGMVRAWSRWLFPRRIRSHE